MSPQDARGDQCDSCGNLLNPTELINPRCKFSGTTPVLRSTSHMFLDLPKLAPQLQEYITATSQLGGWSTNCVQVRNTIATFGAIISLGVEVKVLTDVPIV